jgi:hypothetical protein
MKLFPAILLCAVLPGTAVVVRGPATVYTVTGKMPFAVITDCTQVKCSYTKASVSCIELKGFVDPEEILSGHLVLNKTTLIENSLRTTIRDVVVADTIALFRDSALTDTLGYAWQTEERNAMVIKNCYGKQNRLVFSLYGHIDTAQLIDASPWDLQLRQLLERDGPFNRDARVFALLLGFKDTVTLDVHYEYTWNDAGTNKDIDNVWVFKFGKLKAVWTRLDINGLTRLNTAGKYLYYCDDSRFYIDKVQRDICGFVNTIPR